MQKISTPPMYDKYCNLTKVPNTDPILSPGKNTLAFISRFARVYHVERNLPSALSGMVLN